jgi:putative N-acetylmannosamine-6-phosphate epimerase
MPSKKLRIALLGGALFTAGWAAGQITGTAQAQAEGPVLDPHIVALLVGVASVAVDTEAAAIRINQVADRLATLERRVVQLESKGKR